MMPGGIGFWVFVQGSCSTTGMISQKIVTSEGTSLFFVVSKCILVILENHDDNFSLLQAIRNHQD